MHFRGILLSLLLFIVFSGATPLSGQQRILSVTIDGSINPASAKYLHDAIEEAQQMGMSAVLLRLNTPGGLLQSTREIVRDFLESPLPVIVYVAPGGSQAASAGAFITMAAHVAAMAPGTNIGAAHPVTIAEGQSNIADSSNVPLSKATNDAAAFARSIAEERGRNRDWAEASVRQSAAITETEALRLNVIDLVARDEKDLLAQLEGRRVAVRGDTITLSLIDAEIVQRDMSFQQELLDVLSDPNIAYILLMLGMYGLFFELYNPGAIFPGVVGGICLILAFYSMNTLPVNYAGLALILFGVILFILEVKIVSHGLLSVGGVVSLFLGSIMLIDTQPGLEFLEISTTVILAVTLCSAAFFLFVVGKGIAAQRKKPTTGSEGLRGEIGTVLEDLDPEGAVFVHGERWKARCTSATVPAGARVTVHGMAGFVLIVEPTDDTQYSA
ncbi:MAG: nodulation protein NfeD [Bacteroidia bacterium]|nr:nodulation protein NfeD [Bacteroidia bacterium]